jgi:hypothetical protein
MMNLKAPLDKKESRNRSGDNQELRKAGTDVRFVSSLPAATTAAQAG